MMMKRPALLVAAGGAIAAASALSVISLGFAAFAVLQPWVGAAGAYAIISLAAALLAGLGAFLLTHEPKEPETKSSGGLSLALSDIIRERPGAALGISLLLGLVASKNPRFAMEMMSFAQRLTQPRQH